MARHPTTLAALASRLLRAQQQPHAAGAGTGAARAVSTRSPAAAPPAVADRLSEDEGVAPVASRPRWLRELGVIRNDWT